MIDWDKPFVKLFGQLPARYEQGGKLFNNAGMPLEAEPDPERDELESRARELGVKFRVDTRTEVLRERIEAAENDIS